MFNWNPFSQHRALFDMYHSYSKSIFILTSPSKTPKMRPSHRFPPFIPCGMGKWCRNCHVCLMAGWDSDYFMRSIQELTTVFRYFKVSLTLYWDMWWLSGHATGWHVKTTVSHYLTTITVLPSILKTCGLRPFATEASFWHRLQNQRRLR